MEQIPSAHDHKAVFTAGSGITEDTFGANSYHQKNHVATPGPQNGPCYIDEENLQCRFPRCDDKTFSSIKELRRHAKVHDRNSVHWVCGCCQNLGDRSTANTRKDKVQDHQRKIHGNSKSKSLSIKCPMEHCHTLFTAPSCLDTHLRMSHHDQSEVIPSQPTNGKQSFYER